ncbi:MAG: AmmeMemoRadiSam system protein B [Gemmatimonadaceae bacterium]
MPTIRPPAVAGTFYPARPAALTHDIAEMLAHPAGAPLPRPPKALIVPHAGYLYSGPVAASAYAQLGTLRRRVRRVVVLGPAHHVPLRGLALPEADVFRTPLGEVALDAEGMRQLDALPLVMRSAAAHEDEHSLEVQLPFLQQVLDEFTLLPLVVGEAAAAEVAEVLEMVWGGDETLIVVSSDLSHYLPDARARRADAETVADILALNHHLGHRQACGASPINGLLLAAQRHGLRAIALDVRNSSQTAGDADRVVGYAAFALVADDDPTRRGAGDPTQRPDVVSPATDAPEPSAEAKGMTLLLLARAAIAEALGHDVPAIGGEAAPWLSRPGATFVTLTRKGRLCGCIGSIEARRPLREDVQENAVAAAFQDSRFRPLRESELDEVRVEVSLLSPLEPLRFASETDALAALRPHVDGVVFEYGRHRSVYLPQVWEQLPKPAEFLANLKEKAGLPGSFWAPGVTLSRFTVAKWREPAA